MVLLRMCLEKKNPRTVRYFLLSALRYLDDLDGLPAAEIAQQIEHVSQLLDRPGVAWLGVEMHDIVADEAELV
jgi:hypothetical protein